MALLAPAWRPLPAPGRCRRAGLRCAAGRDAPAARADDALARLRRAKREAGPPGAGRPKAERAPAPPAGAPPAPGGDAEQRFAAAAQDAAAGEERAFLGAMRAAPPPPAAGAAAAPPPILGSSPAAMRARLAKAKEYQASKARAAAAPAAPAPVLAVAAAPAPAPTAAAPPAPAPASALASPPPPPTRAAAAPDGNAAQVRAGSTPRAPALPYPPAGLDLAPPRQAAGFLRDVMSGGGAAAADAALSPEQFTLRREAERRSRGADLITVDAPREGAAAGAAAAGQAAYRPKVATWGVFPRPANISREFGGGRTLRPGEQLEPDEVREARRARVAAAMANYRQEQARPPSAQRARGPVAALPARA